MRRWFRSKIIAEKGGVVIGLVRLSRSVRWVRPQTIVQTVVAFLMLALVLCMFGVALNLVGMTVKAVLGFELYPAGRKFINAWLYPVPPLLLWIMALVWLTPKRWWVAKGWRSVGGHCGRGPQ